MALFFTITTQQLPFRFKAEARLLASLFFFFLLLPRVVVINNARGVSLGKSSSENSIENSKDRAFVSSQDYLTAVRPPPLPPNLRWAFNGRTRSLLPFPGGVRNIPRKYWYHRVLRKSTRALLQIRRGSAGRRLIRPIGLLTRYSRRKQRTTCFLCCEYSLLMHAVL